jgi:DNA-binding transcriptional LysR family regulator
LKSNLQIKHLRYLVVLAKERHFGRAARALAISQPALSQAVQQLEKHFGVPIVSRQQSGFQGFTDEGNEILAWCYQALADHDRLVSSVGAGENSELKGTLRIGVAPVTMSIVSLLTTPFSERHPGVQISAVSRTLKDAERDLRNFDIDVSLNYLGPETIPGTRPYDLYDESYYLLVPEGHYLGDRKSIDWAEVGELPLCLLAPHLQNRVILDRIFSQVGVQPSAVIETDCGLGLFTHIRTGKWLTVVPHSYFYLLGDWALIRSIPIVNPVVTSAIGLLINDRSPVPPVVQAFLDIAEEAQVRRQLDRYRPINRLES